MAESITQPGADSTKQPEGSSIENTAAGTDGTQQTTSAESADAVVSATVVWTPGFISIFFLTLVVGSSAGSLLTEAWLNGWFIGTWVLEGYVVLVAGCLTAILIFAHSWWLRLGSIFGLLWAVFMTVDVLINLQQIDPDALILAYVNAAMAIALCGSFICFSINRTPLRSWDAWFFRLAAIFGGCMVALIYFFPAEEHSWNTLVYAVAITGYLLCMLVWWVRPSCWRKQPGPAFLFGMVPAFLLILSIYNRGIIHTNFFVYQIVGFSLTNRLTDEPNFFFTQVALLLLLLGTMRILQCEIRN